MKKTKILSLVGSTYPLDRLTKQVDELGKDKKYAIFAQIGESSYTPKNIAWAKFLTYQELHKKINWADIIISHAGAGSIIDVLASKKRLLLFPRLKQYDEAIDNHQLEICKALKSKYHIPLIVKNKDLLDYISNKFNKPRTIANTTLADEITKLIK